MTCIYWSQMYEELPDTEEIVVSTNPSYQQPVLLIRHLPVQTSG